jgi:hypothetical protein
VVWNYTRCGIRYIRVILVDLNTCFGLRAYLQKCKVIIRVGVCHFVYVDVPCTICECGTTSSFQMTCCFEDEVSGAPNVDLVTARKRNRWSEVIRPEDCMNMLHVFRLVASDCSMFTIQAGELTIRCRHFFGNTCVLSSRGRVHYASTCNR